MNRDIQNASLTRQMGQFSLKIVGLCTMQWNYETIVITDNQEKYSLIDKCSNHNERRKLWNLKLKPCKTTIELYV